MQLLDGNRLTLLESGTAFFPALEAAIASARYEVYLETYIFADDASVRRIERTLAEAAAQGVRTHVLVDGGGQMAPTTLPGQKTTSSPFGRDVEQMGFPIRTAELLATLDGSGYVVRRSLHDPKNIRMAKKALRTAFETQVRGLGFSMVELLSTCPTNWGLNPHEALKWLEEKMIPVFPIADFKVSPALTQGIE